MNPITVEPSADISKLVKQYFWFENMLSETEIVKAYASEGTISVVFNFSVNKSYLIGDEFKKQYNLNKSKEINQSVTLNIRPAKGILVVCCDACVFCDVFHMGQRKMTYNSLIINAIFDNYPMFKALKGISNFRERICFLENYILNNTSIRNYSHNQNHEKVEQSIESEQELTFQEISHALKFVTPPSRRSIHLKINLML